MTNQVNHTLKCSCDTCLLDDQISRSVEYQAWLEDQDVPSQLEIEESDMRAEHEMLTPDQIDEMNQQEEAFFHAQQKAWVARNPGC